MRVHDARYKLRQERYTNNEVCVLQPYLKAFQRRANRLNLTFGLPPGAGEASAPQNFLTPK